MAEEKVVAVEAEVAAVEAVENANPWSDRVRNFGRRIRHWGAIGWHWIESHFHFSNIVIIAILFLMYIEKSKTFSPEDFPHAYAGAKMVLSIFDCGWKFVIYALKHLTQLEFRMFFNDLGNLLSEILGAIQTLLAAFV